MVGTVVFIILMISAFTPKKRYDEDLTKEKYRISFYEVNIREKPDTSSKIVGTKTLGEYISLSGNIYETNSDIYSMWFETTEGYWIVTDAVLKKYDYEYKFGK